MKRLATLALLLSGLLTTATAQTEVPQITNVLNRDVTSLCGPWHYIVDVQEEGYYDYRMNPTPWGFFRNAKAQRPEDLIEYDFDRAPTMQVPGDWNTQDDRLFFYEGTVWFMRSFDWHRTADRRTLLYFGAVNYDCRVWVNGREAGHHVGGFTPFNFDVTDVLREGENVVIVKVDNKRHAEAVPTQIFDWWNYGGITRDVLLVNVEPTYIENYRLQLEKADAKAAKRTISFTAHLNKPQAEQVVTLGIPELKIKKQCTTDADGNARLSVNVPAKRLTLWSPDNPKRYRIELSLAPSAPGSVAGDSFADSIGFRTIETRGKQLLLNGEPIFLRGICIHEEKPDGGGRANSTADAHTLLSWAKDLGCNFVRLAHYPHNEYAIREAERMGILVWSELPCYWTIAWTNPDTYANAERQLTDMIRRDQNRANVIIWSIANETPHSKERDLFLSRLAQKARSLDTTRLISMAMEVTSAANYKNRLQDNMNEYVDVVSFNQYVGWYRDVNDAPKMEWEIPYPKPVIVSEFGGGAKYGLHGTKNQRWTEEFQENLYRENLQMLDKIDGLAGTTPWVLKDFRSPRRVLDGIQDFYNMKGIYSDRGERKKAFYVLQEWYRKKLLSTTKFHDYKRISVLGDSYSTMNGWITPGNKPFYPHGDVVEASQTWWQQVINSGRYVLECNNSYSGSTMTNNTLPDWRDRSRKMEVSTSFISRCTNLGNPDIILICGGTNDEWNNDNSMGDYKYDGWTNDDLLLFRPGTAYLLNLVKTTYPKAKVYFVLNDILERVGESIKAICAHYDIPVIAPQGIEKDETGHPTQAGMTTIADAVKLELQIKK